MNIKQYVNKHTHTHTPARTVCWVASLAQAKRTKVETQLTSQKLIIECSVQKRIPDARVIQR